MKRSITIAAGLLLLTVAASAPALEVGTEFYIGSLAFSDDRTSDEVTLPQVFPWGGSIDAYQSISDQIGVNIAFDIDPTLNYVSYTLLNYRQQFFAITVGPFFGFFNSRNNILKPGISTGVRADIPGLVFVAFRADSSIGGRLVQEGDYLQERSDVSVGFYVKNAICSVDLLTRGYIYRTATDEVADNYLEYSFNTDLYQKNVPYRILLSFAYQERKKSFIDVTTTARSPIDHRLRSIVLGTSLSMQITDWLLVKLGLDSSVYSFGDAGDELLALPTTGIAQYLFNARIGVTVDIDSLTNRQPLP